MRKLQLIFCLLSLSITMWAQVTLEGYVFEENNRGYLNLAKITVLDAQSKAIKAETISNLEGFFTTSLPAGGAYIVRAEKDVFFNQEVNISTIGKTADDKVFAKLQMKRKPGYLFEVTLAEALEDESVDAITEAHIEIYNNTIGEQVLDLVEHPSPTFSYTLERGNHYTLMIRKNGFFTKRLEAYVDIKGCILCFEGVSDVGPGVSDNLTEGLQMGTLLANIDLERAVIDKVLKFENIYYDYNKATIRPDAAKELDNLISILKDNPTIIVELGSHTDSRGSSAYNRNLSQERAQSAVDYIIEQGGIESSRIAARGYGESQLTNKCADGVKCSDFEHQKNRRTELKVTGFTDNDPYEGRSLKQIIESGKSFEELLAEIQNQEIIEVKAGEELPQELQRQLEQQDNSNTSATSTNNYDRSVIKSEPVKSYEQSTKERTTNTSTIITDPFTTSKSNIGETKVVTTTPSVNRPSTGISQKGTNYGKPQEGETRVEVNKVSANTKQVPATYTGYKVEFYFSGDELPANHRIFTQHGNIYMEKMNNGGYSYLLGDFRNRENANRFLNSIILMRYPNAKVARYELGQRVE